MTPEQVSDIVLAAISSDGMAGFGAKLSDRTWDSLAKHVDGSTQNFVLRQVWDPIDVWLRAGTANAIWEKMGRR